MLIRRRFTRHSELLDLLRGTPVASGNAGTNTGSSANFQDLTADAFSAVSVGDRVHVSGESVSTVFLVTTVTDANNIVLDNPIVAAHSANAQWRIFKDDAIDPATIEIGPIPDPLNGSTGLIIYDEADFGV